MLPRRKNHIQRADSLETPEFLSRERPILSSTRVKLPFVGRKGKIGGDLP